MNKAKNWHQEPHTPQTEDTEKAESIGVDSLVTL